MVLAKGTLIPIGGNEDKGNENSELYSLEFIEEGILYHVVREAGGIDSKIVVLPTASSIPEEVGQSYIEAFGTLGCKNIEILDIRSQEEAKTQNAIDLISSANCVMFSGGDQSKIVKHIGGSPIHAILKQRYENETGFVIAGTSAGAMAMTQEMITGGSATEAFVKGAVTMCNGLGLIPELIIDTHFIRRGRFGRVTEAIAQFPKMIGLGLAEDTGLIIKENSFEIIGSGMVIVFDGRRIKHNNHAILNEGTPMSLTNLKTHILSNGDRFNIKKKKVKILPIEEPFI